MRLIRSAVFDRWIAPSVFVKTASVRLPAVTTFFAATPGGLSEVVLLSDQLGGDMRNVALFHTARLVLIVFSIPLIASFVVTHHGLRVLLVVAFALPIYRHLERTGWFGHHWPQSKKADVAISGSEDQPSSTVSGRSARK